MKIRNIEEAKELVKRYTSITYESLLNTDIENIVRDEAYCILCQPMRCRDCVYNISSVIPKSFACKHGIYESTYMRIYHTVKPKISDIKVRIEILNKLIIEAEQHNKEEDGTI